MEEEGYDLVVTHTALAAFFTRLPLLRRRERPIIGRITHEQYLLDTRTLWESDFDYIAEAAAEVIG